MRSTLTQSIIKRWSFKSLPHRVIIISEIIVSIVILTLATTAAFCQVEWMRYEGNPVLDVGTELWENYNVGIATILFDGSIYRMWYTGNWLIADASGCIAHATSPDGITWTRHAENPVLVKDLDAKEMLVKQAIDLLNDEELLTKTSENIKELALPNSAKTIADEILKLIA